jgi:molybdate transport system substrate-binding protein
VSATYKLQGLRVIFMILAIVAGTAVANFSREPAVAAQGGGNELRVYTSDGFKPALQALIPQIEHSLGRKISPEFDASNVLQKKIESGEPFDVAILASGNLDALIKEGELLKEAPTNLGRAGIGVGLRTGAPKPDISTPEAMKRALLSAKSIEFNRDGASAVHINEMVARLGIADKVKPKFVLVTGAGKPQVDVAAGKSQMVITLIPEIKDFPGLELVDPLPGDLQTYINFSAGIAANSRNQVAAKTLIQFISAPAASTLKRKGIEPH